jgi:hypothetical protein
MALPPLAGLGWGEIKEGLGDLIVKHLEDKHEHYFLDLLDRSRDKCTSTLDQMRVKRAVKLNLLDLAVGCLLISNNMTKQTGSGEEPVVLEDVEDVKN